MPREGTAAVGLVAALLAVIGGCSGSAATVKKDAGGDGAEAGGDGSAGDAPVQGTPYACAGGFIVTADGGEVAAADAGLPATCIVGQTYCRISLPHPGRAGVAAASCGTFPTGVAPAPCAQDPTCSCFCDVSRGGFPCYTQCRCSETNGFATVSCQAI